MVFIKNTLRELKAHLAVALVGGVAKVLLSFLIISTISDFVATTHETSLNSYIILLSGVLLSFVIGFIANDRVAFISTTVTRLLREHLSEKVLRAQFTEIENIGDSKVRVNLTEDTSRVANVIAMLPTIFFSLCYIFVAFVYLLYVNMIMFATFIGVLISGTIIISFVVRSMNKKYRRLREILDDYQNHIAALSLGHKEMSLNRLRRSFLFSRRILLTTEDIQKSEYEGDRLSFFAMDFAEALVLSMLVLMIFIANSLINAPIVELSNFLLVILFIRGPIATIISGLPNINRAIISLDKLKQITKLEEVNTLDDKNTEKLPKTFTLTLENACFTYPKTDDSKPFSVGPVNLSLSSGEVVFIVGGNGCGKSTLIKLICGLYLPQSGKVGLENFDSSEEEYRNQFSAIFSDYYLMKDVISEFGNSVDSETYDALLEELHLNKVVSLESDSFSTINLSQGQKKRLALFQLYVENKPIVVFDEWAADQDPFFRNLFYRKLLPDLKAKGKVVIVVSHDVQYFSQSDRVLKLLDGELKESQYEHSDINSIVKQFELESY